MKTEEREIRKQFIVDFEKEFRIQESCNYDKTLHY
jgi:hypothetical protein